MGYQDSNIEWLNQKQCVANYSITPFGAYNSKVTGIFWRRHAMGSSRRRRSGPTRQTTKD